VLKAGGCYVPMDPCYPAERLRMMMDDAAIGVVLTRSDLPSPWPGGPAKPVFLNSAALRRAVGREPMGAPRSGAAAGNLAYICYTSGSTGRPKGVMVGHREVVQFVLDPDGIPLRPGDRVAQASSASFDAMVFEVWGAFANGATLVGIPRDALLSPPALRDLLREQKVTTLYQTTALLNQLTREQEDVFAGLREVMFGGQAADADSVRRLVESPHRPRRVLHVYGPTETTVWCTYLPVEQVAADALTVSIGRPIHNARMYVLDAALHPLPAGVPGELYVGGACVARGYLNRPALTAERFVPDPFSPVPGARMYRTGDRMRWTDVRECGSAEVRGETDVRECGSAEVRGETEVRECGSAEVRGDGAVAASAPDERTHALAHSRTSSRTGVLEFLGRVDEQVKIRGFRIEPGEVESALAAHPGVREARVVVRRDEPGEPRLVAYVVGEADGDALRAFLRRSMPEYMVPSAFVTLERLPLTPVGKLDRAALPAPGAGAPAEHHLAPRTPVEEALAAIWAEVLRLERVGADENFFELGGHSLLVMRLLTRVEAAFGVEVSIRTVFLEPTLEGMAAAIERGIYADVLAMSETEAAHLAELGPAGEG
jgi:amino acid adenylation domain-containing protein